MGTVSYSETQSYLSCKRKHFYGYTRSLQKQTQSAGLYLGSAGHQILEAFYQTILDAGDTRRAQKAAYHQGLVSAQNKLIEILEGGFVGPDNRESLEVILFERYFPNEPFVQNGWLVQAIEYETSITVDVDGELVSTPIKPDMIVVDPAGKTVVVDHKFLYDFYTSEDIVTMPQIPLYMAGLRAKGFRVDYGMFSMLRTRIIKGTKAAPGATAEQSYRTLDVMANATRVERTYLDQVTTTLDILAIKKLSLEEADMKAARIGQQKTCQFCDFKDLCVSELTGGNTNLLLKSTYKVRERHTITEQPDAD